MYKRDVSDTAATKPAWLQFSIVYKNTILWTFRIITIVLHCTWLQLFVFYKRCGYFYIYLVEEAEREITFISKV